MAALDELTTSLIGHNGGPALDDDEVDRFISALSDEEIEALLAPILKDEDHARFNRFKLIFPNDGEFNRHLYPKHMEFFAMGSRFRERCFMAGNRVGKTVAGAYETTCHLTGLYPDWWVGRRFHKPIRAWVAGDTNETTRDIIQTELLGTVGPFGPDGRKGFDGSGMIPRDSIGTVKWKAGVQDMGDTVLIRHTSGRWSQLGFKSFDQGRRSFQGTSKELIWLDEECPEDIYGECLIRTATTRGILLTTFTPLKGLSETVLQFLPEDMRPAA